jgi:hypothetical protein
MAVVLINDICVFPRFNYKAEYHNVWIQAFAARLLAAGKSPPEIELGVAKPNGLIECNTGYGSPMNHRAFDSVLF